MKNKGHTQTNIQYRHEYRLLRMEENCEGLDGDNEIRFRKG